MKIAGLVLSLMFFTTSHMFAQSETNTVSGTIKEVKPHFAKEHTLIVGETELVLLTDTKDKSGKSFEINKPYTDILLDKKGTFVLNPKYANKHFTFTYTINGKGWKCIKEISAVKNSKVVTPVKQ
jgi:hypothetical protein